MNTLKMTLTKMTLTAMTLSVRHLPGLTVCGVLCCTITSATVLGQVKSVAVSQLTVDVVSLKSGKAVRGAVVSEDSHGALTMAVDRRWLQQSLPDLAQKAIAHEADRRQQATEQLVGRLKKRLATPVDQPGLAFFLKQELERAEAGRETPPPPPQFVWLELERDTIARVTIAQPDRRRLALWSWSELLPNVESRDVLDLQRELKQRKIDPTAVPPDMSERLAPRMQDDREWAARLAVVEYALGKPLDFQGTGNLLVRTGAEQKQIDLAPIMTRVLNSQVDTLLQELTGEPRSVPAASDKHNSDWLKSATREADMSSARGLRATRVEVKLDGLQAIVQTSFAARMPDGTWEAVWSHRETQDGTKPRVEAEARIANDAQVKQITDAVKSFGAGADDQLRQAIRFGAATMAAQQAADAKFFEFRDRYTKHLDGPPLVWAK